MRTVTVDTRGLWFTFKLALFLAVIGTGWSVWGPFADDARQLADDPSVALASTMESGEREVEEPAFMLPNEGRFVVVDVKAMRVTLRDGASETSSFSIVHAPSVESPDALVDGVYSITLKEDSELSTVTMVRFPSYTAFGDRYAFHGTPVDADEAPLPEDYAGSSVLLSDVDASALESLVEEGIQVYVDAPSQRGNDATEDAMLTFEDGALPATSASAYMVANMETGQVYLAKNENARYPIASITKLVTASVASEIIGHGTEILAQNGEHYMLGDLFYPLLLRSDNLVADRIAGYLPRGEFIAHMNTYVRAQGMERTSFGDSSGLSPRNLSTAYDLSVFAKHLYEEKEYLLSMAGEDNITITSIEGHDRLITNQNKLANDPYFRGGKLGYTDEAMQTSLAIFNVPVASETRPVAVIILGSQDWKQDTRTLLRWLTSSLEQ
jgi:D-alanyl-D-alanine endopeptidase (penicillin-binding protein 7)